MKMRKGIAITFYSTLVFFVALLVVVQLSTNLNPVGTTFQNAQNLLGVNIDYNIPSNILPFGSIGNFTGLSAVPYQSTIINCNVFGSLAGTTDTGQNIPLSVNTQTGNAFTTLGNLVGNVGNVFTTFQVREQINCGSSGTTSTYYPNLVSGNVQLWWTATKKDGSIVTVFKDTQPISASLPVNLAGTTATLYTWTVSKSQIENAIGINTLGDNFQTKQLLTLQPTLSFKQGNAALLWNMTPNPNSISYTFQELVTPPLGTPGQNTNAPMTLTVISPSNGQINLQTVKVVRLQATIGGWTSSLGNPELKLLYTDPNSLSSTPLIDVYLNADVSTSSTSTPTFTFNYAFASNAQTGKYTFELHQTGNVAVPKADVYVGSTQVSCPTGQFFNGATNQCQVTTTQTCPDGSVRASSDTCPATTQKCTDGSVIPITSTCPTPSPSPPVTCNPTNPATLGYALNSAGQCVAPTLPNIDFTSIIAWLSNTTNLIETIGIIIVIGVIFHVINKKRGGQGLPTPQVIVE